MLTNQRAIVFDGGFLETTIRSFEPERLSELRRIQWPDGSGDLIFDREYLTDHDGGYRTTDYGFLSIQDVKEIEGKVRELASQQVR